jgi:hypothetical protein
MTPDNTGNDRCSRGGRRNCYQKPEDGIIGSKNKNETKDPDYNKNHRDQKQDSFFPIHTSSLSFLNRGLIKMEKLDKNYPQNNLLIYTKIT